MPPAASIVIPTRRRPGYLDVALASVMPQACEAGAEVVVVSDGWDASTAAVAARHGARLVAVRGPAGANATRNAAVAAAASELVIFVDDDVRATLGWLDAYLRGAAENPEHDVFGGPIRAELEGGGPRSCGREPAPITTLDLGPSDRDVGAVWGANMAIRRRAFERVGGFDEVLEGRGEEEDWERRYVADGGRIRYLAGAELVHRRSGADATVRSLSRAQYALGRTARRNDLRKGAAPTLAREVIVLLGCIWHVARRRCAVGIVLAAHSAGRLREALAERAAGAGAEQVAVRDPAPADDFLSGTSGYVAGIRATSRAVVADAGGDLVALSTMRPWWLRRAARSAPRRRVLVLAIERTDVPNLLAAAKLELEHSHHEVTFASTVVGGRGKFENLNALLEQHPARGFDWLLAIDDDVALPPHFLDTFLFLAERFGLQLAQPAHRARSHAAFQVTRSRATSLVRESRFVEIGPVVAFAAVTFGVLLPFPPLRVGWGLDLHWGAVAREHGWRLGIVDATPIQHHMRPVAASYDRSAAIAEARTFLADRPYVTATEAQRTLATHRRLSGGRSR